MENCTALPDIWKYLPYRDFCSLRCTCTFLYQKMQPTFLEKTSWIRVSYKSLPIWFVEKYTQHLYWSILPSHCNLNEEFVAKFKDWMRWQDMSYHNMSESVIRQYLDYISWKCISWTTNLSEDFIREYCDKLQWTGISSSQLMSKEFIEEHWSYIDIYNLNINMKIPLKIITELNKEHPQQYKKMLALRPK